MIVDKNETNYTICLCIYSITPDLAGKITLCATNEVASDECSIFINVTGERRFFFFALITNLFFLLFSRRREGRRWRVAVHRADQPA